MIAPETAVSVDALAQILEVNRETVYRLARSGAIPAVRVGRVWRFFPTEVKAKLSEPRDPWQQPERSLRRRRRAT